jgi:hypothetical protein
MLFECPVHKTLNPVVNGQARCSRCGRALRLDADQERLVKRRGSMAGFLDAAKKREQDVAIDAAFKAIGVK